MTCRPLIDADVADRVQLLALGRAMDSQALQHGPALTIAQPQTNGTASLIASRCKRMTFRRNESRKRYLAVHRALATYSGARE